MPELNLFFAIDCFNEFGIGEIHIGIECYLCYLIFCRHAGDNMLSVDFKIMLNGLHCFCSNTFIILRLRFRKKCRVMHLYMVLA